MSGFALHLLRHGAPETPGLLMGRTDGPPTAAGIAACVVQAAGLGVERIIASDLCRSRAPAEAVGAMSGLPLTVDPRWRELDFGEWDGLASSAIDPDAFARFWEGPDANPPPGGERWSALVARVSAAIADLTPVPTLIVAHGGSMRAAMHILCGFEWRQLWAFDLPYAARLSLTIWPGHPATAQIIGFCR